MLNFLQSEYRSGTPIVYSGGTITPFAKLIQINLPKLHGGLIWNRPHSILVTGSDGEEKIIQVRDSTRQTILYLFGMCVVFFIFSMFRTNQNN